VINRLILLGPPGAGKGTQAARLAANLNAAHISTGEILRTAVAKGTELGNQASNYMDRGELVPDQLILDLVRERLSSLANSNSWILDGFPRNKQQAIELDALLADLQQSDQVLAINLEVPDSVLVTRLLSRGRSDDTEEVIKNRLEVYRQQTAPLISFYKSRGQLLGVDGTPEVETITITIHNLIVEKAS
jgi:adenylate kinase